MFSAGPMVRSCLFTLAWTVIQVYYGSQTNFIPNFLEVIMANEEHLKILQQGAEMWNKWRELHPEGIRPSLVGANLKGANLSGANLAGVDFSGANLGDADLSRTDLRDAILSGVNLRWADLSGALLMFADFSGAALENTYLGDGARVSYVQGLRLNRTYIRGAIFEPGTSDRWFVLRRSYTGTLLFFHLLILVVFFVPYVARTTLWVGINRSQTAMMETNAQIQEVAEALVASNKPGAEILAQAANRVGDIQPCLTANCEEWAVWEVLIGVDRGVSYWLLVVSLILYNTSRGLLTWKVGLLRDEEERSGYSPAWEDYGWLAWPHRAVRVLLFVSLGSFGWHAYYWLTLPVWLPG